MKIVLIDPGFGESSFNTFGTSHWSSVIHHGLCSLSAYAKSKGFSDIELVDIRTLKNWEHFRKEIENKKPIVIGISMRSCDYNMVMKIVEIIKNIDKNIITIVGGIHPTIMPEDVIPNKKIDYIILGEGEISFFELLKKISNNENKIERVIIGIMPDLNTLPFDDRELYDYKTTLKLVSYPGIMKPPMVTIIGSRGCPFNCTFCAPHAKIMFGKKVRYRSPENVIEELTILRDKYKFKSIKFYDYSFTLNSKWVLKFCELYELNGFNADILVQSRADLICQQESLMPLLKKVGLKLILIGFESGSQRVLDLLKKGTTVEENLKAAEIIKKHGIAIGGSFMLGSPNETKEDVDATVKLAKQIKPNFTSVAFFTPCPGSELYDYCKKNNLSLIKNYEELVTYAPDSSKPKIKGVDYSYLSLAVEKIMGDRFGGKVIGKIMRLIYLKTKKMLKLRHFLVYCYSVWVSNRFYKFIVKKVFKKC